MQKISSGAEALLNPNELTNKQVIGDALQLATTIIGAGNLSGVGTQAKAGMQAVKTGENVVDAVKNAEGMLKTASLGKAIPTAVEGIVGAPSLVQGAKEGFISGLKSGSAFGGATGISQGLQEDKDAGKIVREGVSGALTGGVLGGVLGGVVGGVSGGLQGRALRNKILEGRIGTQGFSTKKFTPEQNKILEIAKTQGFDDSSIQFMNTMGKQDKAIGQKMITLAEEATKNKRALTRPIDILGENTSALVNQVQKKNAIAGKLVDQTAKSLKGQPVDVAPLRDAIIQKLDDNGIALLEDGTLDFSNSVFKNTPAIQKEISKVTKSVPNGSDAYQLHIFKKSIDELVDYGTGGEGLKGTSKNILKGIRSFADDVLDNTFEEYNKANTDFKFTRDFIEAAKDFAGKNVDLGTKEGATAFGQAIRSVFSNNKSRGNAMKFIEDTQNIAKVLKLKGAQQNLLDQAIFTEILEDVYGTQATTSLQGQVGRAVNATQKVISGVRNPIQGAGELVATLAEKSLGVSDENKRKILKALLR